jgi:hypothetical protein
MSIKIKLIFGVLCVIFLTNKLCASPLQLSKRILRTNDSLEILVSCLETNAVKLEQIKTAFANESSFNYLGFCNQHSLLVIRTNQTPAQINQYIADLSKRVGTEQMAVKQIGFGDILNFCYLSTPVKERIIIKKINN